MAEGELGRIYRDDEVIFKEGDEGHNMFVIQAGQVKITKHSDEGEIHIVTLGPGEIFGEMALFDRLPRSATASAEGDARVLSIDKNKLFSTISKDPTVVLKILETMSGTIRRLSRDFTALKEEKMNTLQLCMNTDEICRMILGEVQKHIAAERGVIALADIDSPSLTPRASFGVGTGPETAFVLNREELARVLTSGKTEVSGGSEGGLYVPLKCEQRVFGVIYLARRKDFSASEAELLGSFGAQSSIALQNAISITGFSRIADEVLAHASVSGPV